MTKQIFKNNLLGFTLIALMAFFVLPTDSNAQNRRGNRAANDVYTAKKTRNTNKNYTSTARRSVPTKTSTRNTATRSTATNRGGSATTNRRTSSRATRSTTKVNRRANRAINTNARRASNTTATRPVNTRNTRNTADNFRYTSNERNDYCNTYYRGINDWNRTFWTSNHYTPTYYDLVYNRFPYNNGLKSQKIWHLGRRYYFYDGIWFRKRFGRYHAVDAPVGLCVDRLPIGGEMIWYRGDRFVIYRGTAYKMLPFGGFQVVQMLRRF